MLSRPEEAPAVSGADEFRAVQVALNNFYADCLYALGEHARNKRATANGAPLVLKRVAQEWGLAAAEQMVLPRLTREAVAEREINPPHRDIR